MKIKDINLSESTTSGSVATVAAPLGKTQKRGGNLLTGKKTNKKYANSVNESKMKELANDLRDMDNGNFQKKYKKSKEHMKIALGDPDKKTVSEAHLEEDDLILVPGQGHRLKSGFIPHDQDRRDHEVEMAKSDLFQAAKNAKQVYELIHDVTEDEGLEGWVQEKIIKANDYLNTIREYLEGKQLQNEMNGGVIAGGAGNFEESSKPGLWANIHAKRERIKKGSGERMRKPGSKGAPSAQDFKDAANEGVGEKIKGAVRRMKDKEHPLQSRRDVAMTKGGAAYNKGETRKGDQYMAYAEKDRKKAGDPSTNPAGTYRTKTSDYTNEASGQKYEMRFANGKTQRFTAATPEEAKKKSKGLGATSLIKVSKDGAPQGKVAEAQSMGTALKNTLAKAEPGSKLDNSIKAHNRHIKAGLPGTLKNAPTGYHFDSKGYCRLGDK